MRWEDERYVRVYTRDTPEWSALSWEARAVFWGLLRRCDRAGILQVGKAGVRALAGVIPAPLEVVERAVPELLADGCLQQKEGAYFVPNFMEAQEAHTSDAQRKRDQRERDRARIAAQGVVASPDASDKLAALQRETVTPRDGESRPEVTHGHAASPEVTQSHSVPSRAVPSRKKNAGVPPAAPKETDWRMKPTIDALCGAYLKARGVKYPFDHGKEAKCVQRLLARAQPETLLPAWTRALAEGGYPKVATLLEFERALPHFLGTAPAQTGQRRPTPDTNQGILTRERVETAEEIEAGNRRSEEFVNGG